MTKSGKISKKTKTAQNPVATANTPKQVRTAAKAFLKIANKIDDPRTRHIDYPLTEILFVAVIAVLCGSESYEDFATFGNSQTVWLKQFLPLKNGVPSHDTFRRVFQLLKPESLETAYREIFQKLIIDTPGNHLAVDGKRSRGCYLIKGQPLLNVVSAWDTENGVSFGQVATKNDEGKEVGEFNAIPKLIDMIDVKGKLITIDAGGCYAEISGSIVNGGGDYAITLKENQPTVYDAAKTVFNEHRANDFVGVASYNETDRGHGRIEERMYYAVSFPENEKLSAKWPKLNTLVMGLFRRTQGVTTTEFIRYYISSLSCDAVVRLGRALRSHWGIENGLHWILDVSFGEDDNRTRKGHGAENLSTLRRMALGILNRSKGKKTIPNMKFQAALDQNFRTKVLLEFLT